MGTARRKPARRRKSSPHPLQLLIQRKRGRSSLATILIAVLAIVAWLLPPAVREYVLPPESSAPPRQTSTTTKPVPAAGRHLGRVVRVSDGDTLTFDTHDGSRLKVRLASIDAPETAHGAARKGQPFGEESTQALQRMAQGKAAELECFEVDRYQRHVCRVIVNGVDVNAEQVRLGMAMVYRANRRYVRDSSLYKIEEEAQAAKRGLWRSANPIPPWDWRKDCWQKNICPGGL